MIDWKQVAELRDEIGVDGFSDVVAMFVDDLERCGRGLRPGPGLAEELHYLRGSAMTMGFMAVAELCLQAEATLRRDPDRPVDTATILDAVSTSRATFLRELPDMLRGDAA